MLRGLEACRLSGLRVLSWHSGHTPGALLGALGTFLGPSCGTLGALLGSLGVFLGLPDRHNENTCWLIDFYDDFVLVLGGS